MVFLAFLTAVTIATNPPKIIKVFVDEKACLTAAEELNTYTEVNTKAALEIGAGFVCLKVVDASI